MRGVLLFILLVPTAFAQTSLVIPSLAVIAILSFVTLIYLYFKISGDTISSRPEPPFMAEEENKHTLEDTEKELEQIEDEIFSQEEFATKHADETTKPLTRNQLHVQQLRQILQRQQQSKTQLYNSLHPTHKKHLHKSLHKVVQKYKQRHDQLEKEQDEEIEQALDSFAKLKQYHSAHKKAQVAGSIEKLKAKTHNNTDSLNSQK